MTERQILLRDYRPDTDRFDELVDEHGDLRPAWRPLVRHYERIGTNDLEQRRALANRLLAAEGATHVVHDEGADASRPWAIDPVPLLVTGADWAAVARGLEQRARLLDALLDDLYGPRRVLTGGVVPAEVVLGHRGYQRAALGVVPPAGRRLVSYAADLVRDGQGRFVVLRDHTDSAVGAGYALLNRNVLTRSFPDVYRTLRVERLDGFLGGLRAALAAQAPSDRDNPRTVLLTPGVGDPSYFEHSYLASNLGYHLVEGADLTVLDGRVWLRALGGLEPIDVVLRRVHDVAADPLELEPGGRGGVPGLLQTVREGGVGVANALGSGAAANLGLHPYLPALCQHLLGEPLALPSIASLWCGDPEQRVSVLDRLDQLVLHDTDPVRPHASVFGHRLDEAGLAAWRARILRTPHRYVAQERLLLATTPVLRGGEVVPGTAVIRAQVSATPAGYEALPGGLGRVAPDDVPVLAQSTGVGKDVWVLVDAGERSRPVVRLRSAVPQIDLRASVPSRSAESLFWVGRNAERAEAASRVALAAVTRFEREPELAELAGGAWLIGVLAGLRAVSGGSGAPEVPGGGSALDTLRAELVGTLGDRPGGVTDSLSWLNVSAASVREYLSTSTWRLLAMLEADRLTLPHHVAKADLFAVEESLDRVLLVLSGFAGLAQESIVRGPAWRFLDIGRRLERALLLLSLVEATLTVAPDEVVRQPLYETVLAASESLVAYRRRYRSELELDALCELLLEDDGNPRALAFQLDRILDDLATLPERRERRRQEDLVQGAAAELFSVSWHDATRRPSPDGVLTGLHQVVLDTRGLLLELDRAIVSTWFAQVGAARPVRRGAR